jgi:hypothetical protein
VDISEQARQRFSKDKPQMLIFDLPGTGAFLYTLTGVVTSWTNQFSIIEAIEYPTGNNPPTMLEHTDFRMYNPNSSTEQIRFLSSSPSSGSTARLTYTAQHAFAANVVSTIPDMEKESLAFLLAAYAAQALAADFLKPNRSNIPNDSIDFSQKSNDMQKLADKLFEKYSEAISGESTSVKSWATSIKDFDMRTSFGEPFLIHGEKDR